MGGLVIRGACHYGAERDAPWVRLVSRAFYLGTPHEGAMLEKVAHLMTSVLRAVPHPVAALVGDVAGRRSQGVKDLRDGTTVQAADFSDAVPWLASAQHYLIAGTVSEETAAKTPSTLPRGFSAMAWCTRRGPVTMCACFRAWDIWIWRTTKQFMARSEPGARAPERSMHGTRNRAPDPWRQGTCRRSG